ncbi:ferritin family protein [Paenibacillus sp. SI8]|uniref:ferritin family protein n=1 Tax=unclassified Paenibacillus TaxID=185978 RepID=UPI0034673994
MYYVNSYWRTPTLVPVWQIAPQQAVELIKESVQGERSDELFYDQLIKIAPNAQHAAVIASIRDDERSHNRMFRQMYKDLTGYEITGSASEENPIVNSYMDGLQQAFEGELAAVEKYRKIWFGLPNGIYKDTVYGIIVDEQKHAAKYNNLLLSNIKTRF